MKGKVQPKVVTPRRLAVLSPKRHSPDSSEKTEARTRSHSDQQSADSPPVPPKKASLKSKFRTAQMREEDAPSPDSMNPVSLLIPESTPQEDEKPERRSPDETSVPPHADSQTWEQAYEAAALVCHDFVPQLRILSELHRQHFERRQEEMDLRTRVVQLDNPFSLYLSRRRLLAESRLQRLQRLRERLAGTALVELQTVQHWLREAQGNPGAAQAHSAKLLEAFGLSSLDSPEPGGIAGARALWSLAASLWALGAFVRAELAMLPPATARGSFCSTIHAPRICALDAAGPEDEGSQAAKARAPPNPPPWAQYHDLRPSKRVTILVPGEERGLAPGT